MAGKRGSITDLPYIITGIFTFALIVLLVTLMVNQINDKVQDIDVFGTKAQEASTTLSDDFPAVISGMVLFLFFGLVLVSLVLASLVPIHPVFLIFYIFELLILIWLSAGIANAYQIIIENPVFAVEAGQYELTTFFFRYFPYVIGIVGAILAIVVYKAKERFI